MDARRRLVMVSNIYFYHVIFALVIRILLGLHPNEKNATYFHHFCKKTYRHTLTHWNTYFVSILVTWAFLKGLFQNYFRFFDFGHFKNVHFHFWCRLLFWFFKLTKVFLSFFVFQTVPSWLTKSYRLGPWDMSNDDCEHNTSATSPTRIHQVFFKFFLVPEFPYLEIKKNLKFLVKKYTKIIVTHCHIENPHVVSILVTRAFLNGIFQNYFRFSDFGHFKNVHFHFWCRLLFFQTNKRKKMCKWVG